MKNLSTFVTESIINAGGQEFSLVNAPGGPALAFGKIESPMVPNNVKKACEELELKFVPQKEDSTIALVYIHRSSSQGMEWVKIDDVEYLF